MASDPHLDLAAGAGVHHDLDALHHVKRHVADLQSETGLLWLMNDELMIIRIMQMCLQCVSCGLVGDPGSDEVRIADGLDLVHGVLIDEEVEERVEAVQEYHHLHKVVEPGIN